MLSATDVLDVVLDAIATADNIPLADRMALETAIRDRLDDADEFTPVLATPRNMAAHRGVIAYSPETNEAFSATAGDYWAMDQDDPITDANGEPMILAREVHYFQPIGGAS